MNAEENVMLPLELAGRDDARALAEAALADVGLGARLDHYPHQLSGGEQQRVALARAFVHRPTILFADEPTGNLDQRTGQDVGDLLFELNRANATTLVLGYARPETGRTLWRGGAARQRPAPGPFPAIHGLRGTWAPARRLRMKPLNFAWRTLRREWRYGELAMLAVALLLAVAALGAVATLGQRVERGILASATELIGGDLGLSTRAPLPPELADEATRLGLRSSVTADFPACCSPTARANSPTCALPTPRIRCAANCWCAMAAASKARRMLPRPARCMPNSDCSPRWT